MQRTFPTQRDSILSRSAVVNSTWLCVIFIVGSSLITTWRLDFMSPFSYWDHVPPPYGWGTSPIGWTENLLGEPVWVNGSYWLWPFESFFSTILAKGLLVIPAFLAPLAFFFLARHLDIHRLAAT